MKLSKSILIFICLCEAATVHAQQKNVLFIAVDDLKPLIGAYAHEDIITPNFDRLAAMGTTFTNASCQQSVCAPSRASLLTGLYPDQTEVWDLNTLIRDKNPNVITLPQHLRSAGYVTTGAGKMFDPRSVDEDYDALSWSQAYLHSVGDEYHANSNSGYKGYFDPQVPIDDAAFEAYMVENPSADENEAVKLFPKAKPTTESLDLPDNAYKDGATTEYILEKLEELADGTSSFFLSIGFSKPHLPFVAPKQYWDMYDIEDIDIHPFQEQPSDVPELAWRTNGEMTNTYSDVPWHKDRNLNEAEQKHLIHGYMACVSYIDAQLGKILDKLDSEGLTSSTTIVLWGDHGWHLGDHNMWAKHSNFEQAVMSPLMIADPEVGLANSVSDSPVELVDVFPTLCALLGLTPPNDLDGKSLVPILEDPSMKVREAALSQYHRTEGGVPHMGYTLRDGHYRYTKWVQMDYEEGERYGPSIGTQLYDLAADPHEETNLVGNVEFDDVVDYFESLFLERNIAQSTPSSFLEVELCAESYEAPDGAIYTQDGTYTAIVEAKNGMDSVVTIRLNLGSGELINTVTVQDDVLTADIQNAAYQWYACATSMAIEGATGQSYTATATGLYQVKITSDCGTVTSACMFAVVNGVLGIDDLEERAILFPNPTSDGRLTIQFNSSQNAVIKLLDMSGRVLRTMNSSGSETTLSIQESSGVYLLMIEREKGTEVRRVRVD